MNLLLDTHIFLWYITDDPQLPSDVRDAIREPQNAVYLSAAPVWEAVIKHALGKLPLPRASAHSGVAWQNRGLRQGDCAMLGNLA